MADHDEIPMIMEREFGMHDTVPEIGVGFGIVPAQNNKKSAAAGHPVFEDREYVKIVIPGDKQSLYFQPAAESHRKRFPRAYAAFKSRAAGQPVDGMPIEQWPQVTRSEAMTLRFANIPTVEALAAVHDGHIDKIGTNGRDLRAKAKAFLELATNTAAAQKIASDSDKKDLVIQELQRQIKELADRIGELKRGPGRPPKAEAA